MWKFSFNVEQRKSLAEFLNTIAAAWFVTLFATPTIAPGVSWLTFIIYIGNILIALIISMQLLREDI